MRILIKREQEMRRGKYEYKLWIKIQPTDREKDLLELFDGWNDPVRVLPIDINQSMIKGPQVVTLQSLAKNGQMWSANLLYEIFGNIPQILASEINDLFQAYFARENWGVGENENEVIEILNS